MDGLLWINLKIASQLVPMREVVDWTSHVNHMVDIILGKVVKKLNEKRDEAMKSSGM